jgi:hypothetical protein
MRQLVIIIYNPIYMIGPPISEKEAATRKANEHIEKDAFDSLTHQLNLKGWN